MIKSLEIKSKNQLEAIKKAVEHFNVDKSEIEIEMIQAPKAGFLGLIGNKDGLYKASITIKEEIVQEKEIDEKEVAQEFIKSILKNSNVDAQVSVTQQKNLIKIDISGNDASSLIGRRGETLDSIQLLTGLALNKLNKESKLRVLVDIENYRSKREESLVRYAKKSAREVIKNKKTKRLDYMNPYERRIIHAALQGEKNINTFSEGTDPKRRLVIEYVK